MTQRPELFKVAFAAVLIHIDERAGHGAGKPTSKISDEQADRWAFMFANMGLDDSLMRE